MNVEKDDADKAFGLYSRGQSEMARGEYLKAIPQLEESSRLSAHYKTLELLGDCYLQVGRYHEAVTMLAAATALHSQPLAPFLLAQALSQIGDLRKAIEMARLACQRNPQFKEANRLVVELEERLATG